MSETPNETPRPTIVTAGRKVLHFTAEWCGPCKTFNKEFKVVRDRLPDLVVEDVNVDNAADLVKKYEVQGVPTLVVLDVTDTSTDPAGKVLGKMLALRTTAVIEGFLADPPTDVDP